MSLDAMLRRLPAWRSDSDLTDEDWRHYLDAARVVRRSKPEDVERAMLQFLDAAEGAGETGSENEGRLFLLMRVLFELPAAAPVDQRRIFKGWVNWPKPDAEGKVDLSWPVGWRDGLPFLIARFEGAEGPRYGAVEEYRHLRGHFPFRGAPSAI